MNLNQQPPEKQICGLDSTELDLHSMFLTIQGEGPFAGRRAVFIRLAGCNWCCPWCDTDYTTGRRMIGTVDLVEAVCNLSPQGGERPLAVITGGEPFRQPIGLLCHELTMQGFTVQIETNGAMNPDPFFMTLMNNKAPVHIVVSPKTARVREPIAKHARAFKYVLDTRSLSPCDGLPMRALDHPSGKHGVARPPLSFPKENIYVNPCDVNDPEQNALNLQATAQVSLAHGYTMGVQLHKIIGMP